MSFILVDRDETGSDPEFYPISRILSHFFSRISEPDTDTLEIDICPINISEIEF